MINLKLGAALMSIASSLPMAMLASRAGGTPLTAPDTLYAINYEAGPSWRPGVPMSDQGLRDHFYYVKSLDDRGRIVAAGSVGPDGGLILLRARDQAEADQVVTEDPAVKAGLFTGEARLFIPRFVGKAPLTPVRP